MAEAAASARQPGEVTIHAEWIDADNIDELFAKHGVPDEPDLVSIDLDGNDYWVWRALTYRPRVLVAEYNANISPDESLVMPYDPAHRWNGTDYYGASLRALRDLGVEKGYELVYCNRAGVNAFFVRADLVPDFELVQMTGVGHFLHMEEPVTFNRQLHRVLVALRTTSAKE